MAKKMTKRMSVIEGLVRSRVMHYRTPWVCRVPETLGKRHKTLGKWFAECNTRRTALAKNSDGKANFAECLLSGTRQSLCRVPDTRQSWNRKKPEKMGIFTQKNGIFFIDGGPHRLAPSHLRYFSPEFHGYAADAIQTRDLPLCTYLLYHYTTLSLVSGFRFSSLY